MTNLRMALALLIFLNISSASALSGFLSGWYLRLIRLMPVCIRNIVILECESAIFLLDIFWCWVLWDIQQLVKTIARPEIFSQKMDKRAKCETCWAEKNHPSRPQSCSAQPATFPSTIVRISLNRAARLYSVLVEKSLQSGTFEICIQFQR